MKKKKRHEGKNPTQRERQGKRVGLTHFSRETKGSQGRRTEKNKNSQCAELPVSGYFVLAKHEDMEWKKKAEVLLQSALKKKNGIQGGAKVKSAVQSLNLSPYK